MFLLKKIISVLIYPLTVCIALLISGILLLLFTKKQKTGKFIVTLGVVLLISMSYSVLPDKLLGSLEQKYPPLLDVSSVSDVKWIVVLGGGHILDSGLPLSSRISGESLSRIAEGITIHNKLPQSKMILSGGGGFYSLPESKTMTDMAVELGLDKKHIVDESAALDTEDQANLIRKIVGNDRFILVTSAFHMPRSMAFFTKNGMNPVPAPTGHRVKIRNINSPFMFFPDSRNIEKMRIAVHEYTGLLWAKIRGQA
jgi:uncharacterized SAM-binding protein YcdF (DUF218 family)